MKHSQSLLSRILFGQDDPDNQNGLTWAQLEARERYERDQHQKHMAEIYHQQYVPFQLANLEAEKRQPAQEAINQRAAADDRWMDGCLHYLVWFILIGAILAGCIPYVSHYLH